MEETTSGSDDKAMPATRVDAIVSRLLCKDCGVNIGESRTGRQGRQQTFCTACKKKKAAENKKKQNAAWDFFSQGQFCRRKKKSC